MERLPEESPRFQGLIARSFDSSSVEVLRVAYEAAIKWGAMKEIDIIRDPEVSYNPRPARVAEILIIDAFEENPDVICAGVLSTIPQIQETKDKLPEILPVQNVELAISSKTLDFNQMNFPARQIALANLLDRARHFHMADENRIKELSPEMLDTTRRYIELAKEEHVNMSAKLQSWLSMFERRLRNQYSV